MFPLGRSMQSRKDFEEERRLMYVGVTRTKELLFLTNANVRQTFGETSQNKNSCFIDEISNDLLDIKGYSEYVTKPYKETNFFSKKVLNTAKLESLNSYNKNDLNKGDKITHKKFGLGLVISVTGDNCIIAFPHPYGIKKLFKDHPAISKN